jgi:hypothetical protein
MAILPGALRVLTTTLLVRRTRLVRVRLYMALQTARAASTLLLGIRPGDQIEAMTLLRTGELPQKGEPSESILRRESCGFDTRWHILLPVHQRQCI